MGRGDIKTAKGKRTRGSYGNTRKRKVMPTAAHPAAKKVADKEETVAVKKVAVKKVAAPKAVAEKKVAVPKVAAMSQIIHKQQIHTRFWISIYLIPQVKYQAMSAANAKHINCTRLTSLRSC